MSETAIVAGRGGGGNCKNSPEIHKLKFRILDQFRHSDRPRTVSFLKHFSYKELKRATDGFQRVISSHSFSFSKGTTYEAKLQDGSLALVSEISDGAAANKDAVFREIQLLGNLHHRHLVRLRGYSIGHRSFLVFEGSGYGSLKDYLTDPMKTPLTWKARLQIALGVAAALEYLQFFCNPPVYSVVSISSNNILLDEKFTAKITNIRLLNATDCFPADSSSCSSRSLLSSDFKDRIEQGHRELIPQFGTLLLQLITGQSSGNGSEDAIQWLQDSSQQIELSMHRMIDPDLGNSYNPKILRNLLTVARLCITVGGGEQQQQRKLEPFSISHVHRYLQEMIV